ncbi:TRAP transporter permease [Haloarchaeobius salinus]|uniref:TRAP transporter permease n=1 Tax=Haloarchaeobius salinus TaxID=1198298 RepID=UPI00210AA951|nr:TRAP transporter fused permease subunit [Haloarchaeobius salinus]
MPDEPDPTTDTTTDELSEVEREELLKELERRRTLTGWVAVVVSLVAILFSSYQMWLAARGFEFAVSLPLYGEFELATLQQLQVNAVHVVFALVLAFAIYPPSTGQGFVSRRVARVQPAVRARAGEESPVTAAVDGFASAVSWLLGDPRNDRITPLDYLLMGLSLLTAYYYLTEFREILRMRALGLDAGRTIGEVYTFLSPLNTLPILGESSLAYLLGVAAVLLVLEATRRALGFYLMVIVGSFVVYAKYAYLIPQDIAYLGVLSTAEARWSTIVRNLWYTDQGILGVPVLVSVQFIYIFILFGAFLEASGAGKWFIDLAYSLTGRRKGGPAKASILASGFMGTISGSSIANTVTTGAFTIPLMKRSGYRPAFAGAVEASASSGGQILPPVMGAAAFLIVEYTLTPYADVIVAASVPAIVFFFGVWVMVHLEASRQGIGGVDGVDLVDVVPHLKHGWFYLVPLGLLLYYLIVERLSVARSAWFTVLAIAALTAFVAAYGRRNRLPLVGAVALLAAVRGAVAWTNGAAPVPVILGSAGWILLGASLAVLLARPRHDAPLLEYDDSVEAVASDIADALRRPGLAGSGPFRYGAFIVRSMDGGARTATAVVVAVAAAGIIPGVIATTGLGPNLTALILSLAGGSLVVLLLITAVSCIILGMGMPTTVTYIILVSMLAPAIEEFGVPILAAHLFILYFGVIADITPPVAVAAYAASGVAKSDPFDTGVEAFSLSLNKAIVPFAFVFSPGILLLRPTGNGQEMRVINAGDVADLGFFLPEVVVPIVGVFVGVVALAATVIGYLYTDVSRLERAAFAATALLLMAPTLLIGPLSALVVPAADFGIVARAVGGVGFAALVYRNRRRDERGGGTDAVSTPA